MLLYKNTLIYNILSLRISARFFISPPPSDPFCTLGKLYIILQNDPICLDGAPSSAKPCPYGFSEVIHRYI